MPEPDRSCGLRERKRIRTKQLVQNEAMRLIAEKGYEQTTVEDIAHAAAMSPRTFFRYFPTKEDVVLWDEYDEVPLSEEIRRLGQEGPPLTQLVGLIRAMFADLYQKDPERLLLRTRLSFTVPEIRSRSIEQLFRNLGPVFADLAAGLGVSTDDLELRVTTAAIVAAMFVAAERWTASDGRTDLLALLDDAFAALANGVGRLLPAPEPPARMS